MRSWWRPDSKKPQQQVALICIMSCAHLDKKLTSCQCGWHGRTCSQSQSAAWSGSYHSMMRRSCKAHKLIICPCVAEGGRCECLERKWCALYKLGDSCILLHPNSTIDLAGLHWLRSWICKKLNQLPATISTILVRSSFYVPRRRTLGTAGCALWFRRPLCCPPWPFWTVYIDCSLVIEETTTLPYFVSPSWSRNLHILEFKQSFQNFYQWFSVRSVSVVSPSSWQLDQRFWADFEQGIMV